MSLAGRLVTNSVLIPMWAIAVYMSSKVCAVEDTADGALVRVESANRPLTLSAQKVLTCVGRRPVAAQGLKYRVGRFPTSANGKSLVLGETEGLVKVLVGEEYGEILGVHILAPHAADLIAEAALALRLEATADELFQMIHCHPTVSEALGEAYLAADGMALHVPNRRKKPGK